MVIFGVGYVSELVLPGVDALELRMIEVAKALDVEELAKPEDGLWYFEFSEMDGFEVELDSERQVVAVSQELAKPAAGRSAEIFQTALQYNFLWKETGGGRLSLDGPEGALVFSIEIALPLCDVDYLQAALKGFRLVAAEWREFIEAPADTAQESGVADSWLKI